MWFIFSSLIVYVIYLFTVFMVPEHGWQILLVEIILGVVLLSDSPSNGGLKEITDEIHGDLPQLL